MSRILSITIPYDHEGRKTKLHRALCADGTWAVRSIVWDSRRELECDGKIHYVVKGGLNADQVSKQFKTLRRTYFKLGIICETESEL